MPREFCESPVRILQRALNVCEPLEVPGEWELLAITYAQPSNLERNALIVVMGTQQYSSLSRICLCQKCRRESNVASMMEELKTTMQAEHQRLTQLFKPSPNFEPFNLHRDN